MAIVFGSPEAKAILEAKKERNNKEKEKAEESKYKWVDCDKCNGSGNCYRCHNAITIKPCEVCDGDGACPYCDGAGEVQMVKTERGWEYVLD